jgi:hypothetical protein
MTLFVLTWVGLGCWCVCFWWMHRISSRQDAMLKELHEMTQRIEQPSQAEHNLIKEVHPRVHEIKEQVETVKEAVSPEKADPRLLHGN